LSLQFDQRIKLIGINPCQQELVHWHTLGRIGERRVVEINCLVVNTNYYNSMDGRVNPIRQFSRIDKCNRWQAVFNTGA